MADRSKVFLGFFVACVLATSATSILLINHAITGDAPSYLEAMEVMQGGDIPPDFVPNRILTSSLAIESISLFTKIFGSVKVGWATLDIVFFFILSIVFYKLIFDVFDSHKTALLAGLFLITNYAMVVFALDYGVDVGGWAFYVMSLYLTLKYVKMGDRNILLYSALCIGIGGLFKEYALLATIPIAVVLLYENWLHPITIIKKGIVPALISLAPLTIVYLIVFLKFDYTYIDWISYGSESYVYTSKITEYIKSFGSLFNLLAPIVAIGAYCFVRYGKEVLPDIRMRVFVISVALSSLPVFVWPAITQRVLFITVPAVLLVASFAFKRYEKYWIAFWVVLIVYTTINFTMDSFILPNVNIGPTLDAMMGN